MIIKDFLLSWGMLFTGTLMNVFGVYVIKMKINTLGSVQFTNMASVFGYFFALIKMPLVILGGIAILAAPLPYAIALSKMELSTAYPITVALNCLLILPLTAMFLGESVTPNKITAICLILVSLYLLYK